MRDGLRVGWIRAPHAMIGSLIRIKSAADLETSVLAAPEGAAGDGRLRVLQEWTVQMNMLRRGVRRTGQNVNQIARLLNGGGCGGVGRGRRKPWPRRVPRLRKLDPLVEWMTHTSGMGQA